MSDKTYAESVGAAPFDWWKALDSAIKNQPNEDQARELSQRAERWTTCACGNQCAIIPRGSGGIPKDVLLSDLGAFFFDDVRRRDWSEAKIILGEIEGRSKILIAAELAKLAQQST